MDEDKIQGGLWHKTSKQPDKPGYYGGSITINGQEYWANVYKNEYKKESKHPDLNLVLKPKEPRPEGPVPQAEGENDIPF